MTQETYQAPSALYPSSGSGYELPEFPFVEPPELRGGGPREYPVVVIGGGLVGLTMACDLAQRGIAVVLLDEDNTIGVRGASSRGICYAQKTLEIFRRLGIYERVRAKGIQWSVGRTLVGDDEVYSFDMSRNPASNASCQPAYINIQQFYIEWFLADRIEEIGGAELRWQNRVVGVRQDDAGVELDVDTPAGQYSLRARWVVDCSGLRSPVRDALGVLPNPSTTDDRWCISDVRFAERPPIERWTWLEAPFNDNRAVWQHLMADDVWRLDYQMAPDSDPEVVSSPAVVDERLRRQFGPDVQYELVWVGAWSYRSYVLDRFRCGRVVFAGDCAHVMSPFGARGGNSGIQDADNLGWKLDLVLHGLAPESLLDSYERERRQAALENVAITQATGRFLHPRNAAERTLRDTVVGLARRYEFARPMVNSGRLSSPTRYVDSALVLGPQGGRSIQNVALALPDGEDGDLVGLAMQSPSRIMLIAASGTAAERLAALALDARLPVRSLALAVGKHALPVLGDPEQALRNELALHGDCVAVLRPDLHHAGCLELDGLESALATLFAAR